MKKPKRLLFEEATGEWVVRKSISGGALMAGLLSLHTQTQLYRLGTMYPLRISDVTWIA